MSESFKFCSGCGGQNHLSAQFCQSCGAKYDGATTQRKSQPLAIYIIAAALTFGCCALAGIGSMFSTDKTPKTGTATTDGAPNDTSDYEKSAARERLENKIHAQALVMLGLEDTTVITSQDKLLVKIPRLTQRDVLLESDTYRPILRAWMNALKTDFAAAGVTNVCVYESAWSGLQICANPAGESR